MAWTIHERSKRRLICLRIVRNIIRHMHLHLQVIHIPDVLQFPHGLLSMHHQRLHPDDRHLLTVYTTSQLASYLGILCNPSDLSSDLFMGYAQRWHILWKTEFKRIRWKSNRIHIYTSSSSTDIACLDQIENTGIYESSPACSLFRGHYFVRRSGNQEHDRVCRVFPNHYHCIKYILT